jgi:[acyl-carrier-protein] S-malonyltransferase
MGQALAQASATAREVFQEVDDALGQNLSKLMALGPADELTLTENAQPAIMAVSLATIRVLEKDAGVKLVDAAAMVAGHSLGEYSALCAAGALPLAQTAKLLKLRGTSMQAAVPVGVGAMAALLGVDLAEAQGIAEAGRLDPETGKTEICTVANDNAPGQIVISGHSAAVNRSIAFAKEKGKKAIALPVSAPFHCPLMQPAADAMAKALETTPLQAPFLDVYVNVKAAPFSDPEALKSLLIDQICGIVRWRESIEAMVNAGADTFVECGGKVLSGMIKRINRDATTITLEGPSDIEALLKSL